MKSKAPIISARKKPRQARSSQMVDDILEAAIRVLVRDGAHRFTAARVAETAGVSVGSLYQYFPNKEAILFRLQTEEWQQTMGELRRILSDASVEPPERLRAAVQAYFRSECEEAAFRSALEEAAPLHRDAPETRSHVEEGRQLMLSFIRKAMPDTSARERTFVAEVVGTIMSSVGKTVSNQDRSPADVDKFAVAVGDMLCAFLQSATPSKRDARPGRPR